MDIPRVRIIAVGGTIASTVGGDDRARPTLTADALVRAVPGLEHVAEIGVESLDPVPSCSMDWSHVLDVAARIARARTDGCAGVVITQGTDTLEETAFAWDLLTPRSPAAVVVTGAMRHADMPGADGPANLLDAVRLAASPAAGDHGVLVTLAGQIHAARTVTKRHTSSVSAFGSPTGQLGEIVEDRITLAPADRREVLLAVPTGAEQVPVVPLVRSCIGDHGWWLPAVAAAPGVVVEGMGGGCLPVDDAIGIRPIAGRTPVVLASRTGAGEVLQHTYGGFPGSETDLIDAGLIPAGDLSGVKARTALALALATGLSRSRIAEVFAVLGGYGRSSHVGGSVERAAVHNR